MDSKTWNCRPSDLVAIEDPYVAYCFDQAVGHIGRSIEAELDKVESKSVAEGEQKRKIVLERFLGDPEKPSKGLYADPAAMMT